MGHGDSRDQVRTIALGFACAFVIHYGGGSTAHLDALADDQRFEIDDQAAHLFKHAALGIDDIYDVWRSDPLFYPAIPPAHWLMVAEVAGQVLVDP